MRIDVLQSGDEALLRRAEAAFNDEPSPERAAMLLRDPSFVMIVATGEAGEVLGRIYANVLNRPEASDLLLYEVDVEEAHRRRGVGRAMVDHARALARERGYGEVWVLTEPDNEMGNGLYRAVDGLSEAAGANMYVFATAAE